MERYICIHGHFYQPPRENPWLERIELQDSAYPYHDWNERVTAECYAPNAASRILDERGRIVQIVNNYAKISFNVGPTLMAWLEPNAPEVYRAILEADRESERTFSGHGSALAQAYNHMILPLANPRDKHTQVRWGIRDFEHRFGRKPEGMWLPETAVDMETLDVMAQQGIRFTILAPRQARRVRPLGSSDWQDVSEGKIDTTLAYILRLPSGRNMSLFFYSDVTSRAVAFEGLLSSGEQLAQRLLAGFSQAPTRPQLVHIATDGETYGHHHRFGDMALAYALHSAETSKLARLTNYGEYLEKHPPTHEVEVLENTSWSCAHGVERWRSNCGCSTGGRPGWSQEWRAPLREALDWLRDTLAPRYEEKAAAYLKDPWAARDGYIDVVLDRSPENLERFLTRHATRSLEPPERVAVLKLLELQRHAMLMYTSCGWFFADISGIETVQVLQYAGRTVQLAQQLFGNAVERQFLRLLERARSNRPEHPTGRHLYEEFVRPAMVDLAKVAAHYAVISLFEEDGERTRLYCYLIDREDYRSLEAGRARVATGRARFTCDVTKESALLSFGVLYFGDHNLNVGVQEDRGEEAYQSMAQEVAQSFALADFAGVIRLLDKHFGASTYSLRSLFRDEQRRVLGHVLEATLAEIEGEYREIYQRYNPLARFLTGLRHPLPKALSSAVEFVLNAELRKELGSDTPALERIRGLLQEAETLSVAVDAEGLGYVLRQTLEGMMARFLAAPEDSSLLRDLAAAAALARSSPFAVNLWKAQNLYYDMLRTTYPDFQRRAQQGNRAAEEWVGQFRSLGEHLSVQVA